MSSYLFYIDDSGTKEYATRGASYSISGNSRYFCFGGVLLESNESSNLGSKIADHKRSYFGTDTVEIKSNWLRMPIERNKHYLSTYPITDQQLDEFVLYLYDLISSTDLQLIAAVVDKEHMQEDYGESAWYPPAVAYEILLQRLVQEITYPNVVSIIIDDMSGATPRGNQYKTNLKQHHRNLKQYGSRLIRGLDWRPLQGIRFVDSADFHHIQVADIVAYNVFRQFVEHGDDWENIAKQRLEVYPWLMKLESKFRNDNGRIQGHGIIKMPLRQRIRWAKIDDRTL